MDVVIKFNEEKAGNEAEAETEICDHETRPSTGVFPILENHTKKNRTLMPKHDKIIESGADDGNDGNWLISGCQNGWTDFNAADIDQANESPNWESDKNLVMETDDDFWISD